MNFLLCILEIFSGSFQQCGVLIQSVYHFIDVKSQLFHPLAEHVAVRIGIAWPRV